MDTYRLKYFCALVEFGSLSKASDVLGVSHSGLSKSLSLLQKEVELQLVRPLGRGLEVTKEGKLFYAKAQEILGLIDELPKLNKVDSRPIRIGASEILSVSCSTLFAQALKKSLKLSPFDVGGIEHAILNDEIDFAIASVLSPNPNLEYLSLGKIRFNSYVHRDLYRQYKQDVPYAVPIDDLPHNLMGYKLRDGWPPHLKRKPFFYNKSYAISLELLRSGEAAAFIPDFVAKQENSRWGKDASKLIKVKEHQKAQTDREYFLIKHKSSEESSEMKKIARVIRRLNSPR